MSVHPVPEGYSTVTPHLVVSRANDAIEFYAKAFGAQEVTRHEMHGKVMHAALKIGDSMLMVADEFPEHGSLGPDKDRVQPVTLHLFVDNVDELYERATKAGVEPIMPLDNMFWGDRYAIVRDPFGHNWSMATRVEDLSPEEMERRAAAAFSGDAS